MRAIFESKNVKEKSSIQSTINPIDRSLSFEERNCTELAFVNLIDIEDTLNNVFGIIKLDIFISAKLFDLLSLDAVNQSQTM